MTLLSFNPKSTYRDVAGDDLLNSFYIPCLERSVHYTRAVGFFSPNSLTIAGRGLSVFLKNKGNIKLIFNAQIEPDIFDAIKKGKMMELLKNLRKSLASIF